MEPAVYLSFLVRLWREQGSEGTNPTWHSEVEHIQSGASWRFDNLEAALYFLQQATETPPVTQQDGCS